MCINLSGALPINKSGIENEDPLTKLKEVLSVNNVAEKHEMPIDSDVNGDKSTVSITVVGASGDLAKKKIFPALFALYYEDCLPEVCPTHATVLLSFYLHE